MKHETYAKHVEAFTDEMRQVTAAKNADYSAGTDDAMRNYYELANAAGCTPMQSWMVLMMKHVTAIMRYAKTGSVSSETIHGRFVDLANYALLGDALVTDMTTKGGLVEGERRRMCPCPVCDGQMYVEATAKGGGTRLVVDCPACCHRDKSSQRLTTSDDSVIEAVERHQAAGVLNTSLNTGLAGDDAAGRPLTRQDLLNAALPYDHQAAERMIKAGLLASSDCSTGRCPPKKVMPYNDVPVIPLQEEAGGAP